MHPAWLWVGAFLGGALAGCADEATPAGATVTTGGVGVFGNGTASLRGQVLDVELAPVAGALVGIDAFAPLTTDDAGRFGAEGLDAGDHVLQVTALGFVGVSQRVVVGEGEAKDVTVTLDRVPSTDPYLEVLVFRGYSVCILVYWIDVATMPCANDPNAKNFEVYNISASWRFLVLEAEFTSGQIGGYDAFRLFTAPAGPGGDDCANGDPCYGQVYGQKYARVEGEPGKTEIVKHYDAWIQELGPPYPDGPFDVQVNAQWIGYFQRELGYGSPPGEACRIVIDELTGGHKYGCLGVGMSTGITFDTYTSVFHWEKPPLGECCPASTYTALPDR